MLENRNVHMLPQSYGPNRINQGPGNLPISFLVLGDSAPLGVRGSVVRSGDVSD